MNFSRTILSTKKLRPGIIDLAGAMNIDIIEHPFIGIVFTGSINELYHDIVFTSQYAVKAFMQGNFSLKYPGIKFRAHCLQGETLQSVKQLPQLNLGFVAANAAQLARQILADTSIKSVSFICGEKRRDELPLILRAKHIVVDEIRVYDTKYTGTRITANYASVLFFSPSAVESFFQTNMINDKIICFCIGETTAEAVKQHCLNTIVIAPDTTQESMINTAGDYFARRQKKNK